MQSANTTRSWDVNRATRERARGWRKQGQQRHCLFLTESASQAVVLRVSNADKFVVERHHLAILGAFRGTQNGIQPFRASFGVFLLVFLWQSESVAHHEAVGSMAAVFGFVVSIRGGLAV